MKKYLSLSIAVILTAALCGCSENNDLTSESTQGAVSESEAQSSAESAEIKPPSGAETFLEGLAGDKIRTTEITQVFTADGTDRTPEELTEENFSAVLCEGFAYLAEPSGISRNDRDNADVYDSDEMLFTDISTEPLSDYIRVNVGDEICGLKLVEATANFARGNEQNEFAPNDSSEKSGAELELPSIYFAGATARFEGELAMEGYICRIAEDEYGFGAGDIIFVPCDGGAKIPASSYRLDGDNGFHHIVQTYALGDLVWANEFGYLRLGSASETTADISMLPDDGSFVKAAVTAHDLSINSGVNFVTTLNAQLDSVDLTV